MEDAKPAEQAAEVVEVVETAQVAEGQEAGQEDAEARRMGWVPKEEFRGDDSRWRDAKTFLERGKREVPIMAERMKAMDNQIRELKGTLKEFGEYHTKVEQASYERAYNALKEQQKAAVELADVESYDRLDNQIQELNKSLPPPTVKVDDAQDEPTRIAAEWENSPKNAWIKDKEMHSFAYSVGQHLRVMGNNKPLAEFLDDVALEVKRLRPEKFTNSRREEAPDVEGNRGMIRGKGKGFNDLTAEAKSAAERFVKQGLFKSKEDYAKDYFTQFKGE